MSNPSSTPNSTTAESSATLVDATPVTRDFDPPAYAETVAVDNMEDDITQLLSDVRDVSTPRLSGGGLLILYSWILAARRIGIAFECCSVASTI